MSKGTNTIKFDTNSISD